MAMSPGEPLLARNPSIVLALDIPRWPRLALRLPGNMMLTKFCRNLGGRKYLHDNRGSRDPIERIFCASFNKENFDLNIVQEDLC